MIKEVINKILDDIEIIENTDVLKKSVEDRLNQSLARYCDDLNKSYEELVSSNYGQIVRSIVKKGKK